ncbi:DNA internalization-related competence protein ComEC/Rec2 [Halomonas vilamensis]|uniref:DNA internalization-related competence protein ComEC/Rec2 n=1 Tax=Vreelandella vilamensis TaxID=531309 RepID=A0ABU1H159_9GAMM|nr:DNA internalization-related competence protein ComEC/Rec2 [Halomonas vilamensis]MDR5898046.1 DNA internalization-related competence protein ComEC/Rec2 [Halomonas vilamensis]
MQLGIALPAGISALGGAALAYFGVAVHWPVLTLSLWLMAALLLMIWRPRVLFWWVISTGVLCAIHAEQGRILPLGLSGEDIHVQARIVSVSDSPDIARLTLHVIECAKPLSRPSCERLKKVRVSAYGMPYFQPGERWQMTLRLRPPSGFDNPHTFHYGAWLWREGIHATGYVRQTPAPSQQADAPFSLRRQALTYLHQQPLDAMAKRWLAALTLGESEALSADDWSLLNASGTTHLVVISGLHVGLIASFSLLLARTLAWLWTPHHWKMRAWPWWVAAAATVAYASFAGFGPPAMRAMIMALIGLWVLSGRHAPGAWQAWWLALSLVVLFDPLSVWRPGFWLSFVAVAWLIVIWQGRTRPKGIRGWGWALCRTQLLLAPLMAGAVLLAFGRVSPVAPLVNLFAVPWVSMLMVPSALLGWLLAPIPLLGDIPWWLFSQLLRLLQQSLEIAIAWAPLWEPNARQGIPLALAFMWGALCWGLPATSWWLRISATGLVALMVIAPRGDAWPEGALRVRVYDVGQGQLVELKSGRERMLYDTGPRFRSGFMPLNTLWPPGQYFDRVLVSHADNDHAGGVQALMEQHTVARWLAPQGEKIEWPEIMPCYRGQQWQQGGVMYKVLWPPAGDNRYPANDRSCVLSVHVGEHILLITGDVGIEVERRLLMDIDAPLSVLIAGHHGSQTSSGVQFVRDTSARHVIFSAGRDNSFGHPADRVVRRFRREESCLWSTAHDGALTLWLIPDEPLVVAPSRDRAGPRRRC